MLPAHPTGACAGNGAGANFFGSQAINEENTSVASILLVDDDAALAHAVAKALVAVGHDCRLAYSAQEAMDSLDSSTDLLILDIMMPGVSGFEVCRRVRADATLFTLPILFVSAIDSEEEIAHGLAQGADDYVTKPFQMAGLLKRVDALLGENGKAGLQDPQTDLPGAKAIKLELQRRLNRHESFEAVYIELLGLIEYTRVAGPEERGRALRHLGRILTLCGAELADDDFVAGHLGGGHFVCLTPPGTAAAFARRAYNHWSGHAPRLVEAVKGAGTGKQALSLEALICSMPCLPRHFTSTRELFDTLNQIRAGALTLGAGVYEDRRTRPHDTSPA